MKKLMILGAGVYQLPLIEKARALGLFTIVCSIPGDYPGFAMADQICYLDTTDEESILALAKKEQVDGITTCGTDVAVRTIGFVNESLGLSGIRANTAEILTDKIRMKEAFTGHLNTAPGIAVSDSKEAGQAAAELTYPVMVKACDVSGSRGITKVDSEDELFDALKNAADVSHKDRYLIESFVPGTEIGMDAFIQDGKVILFLPHDKAMYQAGGSSVPMGHRFPSGISEEIQLAIRHELDEILAVSGYTDGALNADLMITPDGQVFVIEAGGRAGATGIPELIAIHAGIDYYAWIIKSALGEKIDPSPFANIPCESRLLFSRKGGIVRAIDHEAIHALQTDRVSIRLDVKEGDVVRKAKNGTDRFGDMIVRDPLANELSELEDKIRSSIYLVPEGEDHV